MRRPSGDHAGCPNIRFVRETSPRGDSPLSRIIHISAPRLAPLTKAICDPSGETAAIRPSSISLRGAPPMIDTSHRPDGVFAVSAQLATRCVPSGYQLSGVALKPLGT